MFDREIALDSLRKLSQASETAIERVGEVVDINELLSSSSGMLRLDAICMNLIAIGEAVKGLDKQTHGELLPRYPEIYWAGVMRMRDKIAHHYFEIDAEIVIKTVREDIPLLKKIVDRMIDNLMYTKTKGSIID